jgi:hypothetical protein
MSFRLFIYYGAAWGGASGYLTWALGRLVEDAGAVVAAGVRGLSLGLLIALCLGMIDSRFAGSQRDAASVGIRLFLSMLIGAVGGLAGGFLGYMLFDLSSMYWTTLFGWILAGLWIGVASASFDFLAAVLRNEDRRGARRKLRNGLLGGGIGGLLGGVASVLLPDAWADVFPDSAGGELWTPSASAFVALGLCIGLSVALTQVILREAWVRVDAGDRPGRQVLLTRPEMLIGRAATCDVGLAGEPEAEEVHARITREGNVWYVADADTLAGTLLNGQPLTAPMPLRSRDRIQVGDSVVSFGTRWKVAATDLE